MENYTESTTVNNVAYNACRVVYCKRWGDFLGQPIDLGVLVEEKTISPSKKKYYLVIKRDISYQERSVMPSAIQNVLCSADLSNKFWTRFADNLKKDLLKANFGISNLVYRYTPYIRFEIPFLVQGVNTLEECLIKTREEQNIDLSSLYVIHIGYK